MMQANELRIGNWVKIGDTYRYLNLLYSVDGVFVIATLPSGFSSGYGGMSDPLSKAQHIPLNPEILEKCGFKEDDTYKSELFIYLRKHEHDIDKITFSKSDSFIRVEFAGRRPTPGLLRHIKYLHQLQNLYFSLTGKELEVTL